MRSALECAPKKCKCGKRLAKPHHHEPRLQYPKLNFGCNQCDEPIISFRDKAWAIKCSCHRFYVWSWHNQSNGCWMIRSHMPLFDTKEIVVVA